MVSGYSNGAVFKLISLVKITLPDLREKNVISAKTISNWREHAGFSRCSTNQYILLQKS